MIDLRPDHLEIVRDLLRQHVPECEVRAFGSRFKWTAKQASDLDLAVVGTKRLPTKKIMRLKEAFEESILPMRVDVLDWHAITPEFQRVIDAGFEVIQGGEASPLAAASSPSAAGSSATPLEVSFRSHWLTAGGTIPDGWEFVSIESLLETPKSISVGVMYPGDHTPNGIPLIKVSNVSDGIVSGTPEFCISEAVHEEYKRTALNGSELLITLVGNPGDCVIASPRMAGWNVARALAVMRFKDPDIRAWVRFVLISEPAKHFIDSRLNTTVQKTLNLKDLKELGIPLPPRRMRDSISSILATLDNRIELCRSSNETLEAMARAVFKDWFIDFGPVRAKLERRESYLSKDILDLFPDRIIESDRGEIPEGWSYGSILSIARLLSGGTPKTSEESFWDGEIKWASAKDVSQCGETFLLETERKITNLGLEKSSTKLIPAFSTVIVARGATTGRLTMFGEEMAMNQTCYGLQSKFNAPFALYCHTRDFIDSMVSAAHGSVFDTITTQTFEATPVLLPSEKILKAFDQRTSEIFSQILLNLNRMRTLVETRDFLLPRLLSGELSTNQIQGFDCA